MGSQYNVICDRCGFKYKSWELKKEWTGFMVCNECWEPRHPQDMIKGVKDQQPLPYTKPDNDGPDVGEALNTSTAGTIPAGTFTTNNRTL